MVYLQGCILEHLYGTILQEIKIKTDFFIENLFKKKTIKIK